MKIRSTVLPIISLALACCLGACSGGGNAATSSPTSHMGVQGDIFGDWDTGTPVHTNGSHNWGVDY